MNVPQGLKPTIVSDLGGTTEVVPFPIVPWPRVTMESV
jgi:hypothetical protein